MVNTKHNNSNLSVKSSGAAVRALVRGLASAVLALTMGACTAEEMNSDIVDESETTTAAEFTTDGETIANLEYGHGTRLHFIALPDEAGNKTVGVLERAPSNGYRLDLEPILADANPREMFHAVSTEAMSEPPLLAELFPEPRLGHRGWFLDAIDEERVIVPKTSCHSSSFRYEFENWRSSVDDGMYLDTYASPPGSTWRESDAFGVGECEYSDYPCLYSWSRTGDHYTYYNVDRYKTMIQICAMQYRTIICHQGYCYDDFGPLLSFSYRTKDNAYRGVAFSENVDSTDAEGYYWSWYWTGSSWDEDQADWDWKTSVDWAWTYDEFMIGVAYEHEGW